MSRTFDWCPWCGAETCTEKYVAYEGDCLAVRQDDGTVYLHPLNEGAGGPAMLLDPAALDGLNGPAALLRGVVVLAERHPGTPVEDFEMTGSESVLLVRARPTAVQEGWRFHFQGGRRQIPASWISVHAPWAEDLKVRQGAASAPAWTDGTGLYFEDLPGYRRERLARDRAAFRTALESDRSGFVNPYSFVPLGDGPHRSAPAGHDRLGNGRFSGSFDVEFTAQTQLALSGAGAGSEQDPLRPVALPDGTWMLPGSSIAGAARALHEAWNDSCLRVVDQTFVPVHREPAVADATAPRRRMAVAVDAGTVRVCDPVTHAEKEHPCVWVKARLLPSAGHVTTGDRFHFDISTAKVEEITGELRHRDGTPPTVCANTRCDQEHWIVLVSSALQGRNINGPKHFYHLAFAPEGSGEQVLSPDVLSRYHREAAGSNDVVRARRQDRVDTTVPRIGNRQTVTMNLNPGDVVWVDTDPRGEVERIRRSVLWRRLGEGTVSERIGDYHPCSGRPSAGGRDQDLALCPSCRVFGSIENRQDNSSEAAEVFAYRGHVRVEPGRISAVDDAPTLLREMGSPRPGSGQFYLENNRTGHLQARKNGRPLREWGSDADTPQPRRIRGRKRYWLGAGGRPGAPSRHAATTETTMTSHQQLIPAGGTVRTTVRFDNLSLAEIGGLILSLAPQEITTSSHWPRLAETLPDHVQALGVSTLTLGTHLGRGKGLGLGSVVGRVVPDTWLCQGPGRYTGATADTGAPQPLTAVEAFAGTLDTSTPKAGTRLAALLTMLVIGAIPDQLVRYPPDDNPSDTFRFDFWRRSTGAYGTVDKTPAELVPLPTPDQEDPRVPRPWLGNQGQG